MRFRQLTNRGPHQRPSLPLLEQPVGLQGPFGEILGVVSVFEIRGEHRLDGFLGLAPARPELHEGRVDDDAVKPGGQLTLSLEGPQSVERGDVRRLDRIAGIFVMAKQAPGNREHPAAVCPDQQRVCVLVPDAESGQQGGLVNLLHSRPPQ